VIGSSTERRLKQASKQLKKLKADLEVIEAQRAQLWLDSEGSDPKAARHVDSHEQHRVRVINKIAELERRQDELLDELTRKR
jgi:hypothetical protein